MGSNNEYEHQSNWESKSIEELKKLKDIAVKGQWYKEAVEIRDVIKKKENDAWWDSKDPEGVFRQACKNLIDTMYPEDKYKVMLTFLTNNMVNDDNKEYKWELK